MFYPLRRTLDVATIQVITGADIERLRVTRESQDRKWTNKQKEGDKKGKEKAAEAGTQKGQIVMYLPKVLVRYSLCQFTPPYSASSSPPLARLLQNLDPPFNEHQSLEAGWGKLGI